MEENNTKTPATTSSLSLTNSNAVTVMARLNDKFAAVRTPSDCVALQAENPDTVKCLLRIKRESDDNGASLKKTLATLLFATDRFLHLKEGMSNEEIFFTAENIISEYGGMITFADIKVIFTDARLGKYGKMYERLSCATVMDWFNQYIDNRLNAAEQYSIRQARRTFGTPQERMKPKRPQPSDDDSIYKEYKAHVIADIIKRENND